MRTLSLLLISAAALLAQPNTLSKEEKAGGWLLLFDGKTLNGWAKEGDAVWNARDGAIVTEAGGNGWLRSEKAFGDFIFRCEVRTHEKGNSGIFMRSAKEGQPHITGYELQIWNYNDKFPTGSFVNHVSSEAAKLIGDQWNSYEVTAKGDHWVVLLNGRKVLDTHQGKSASGHFGLQSNKDKIEFRNMRIKPL
jgi:hypothetical protein